MAKISLRSGGNKKVTQAKSLSNNNARYSTTNRKGVTTYYGSAKDASGYNDSFEGKGTTSKGVPLSQRDATGNIITSNSIKPVTTTPVPTVTQGADVGNIVTANNAGLANAELGITSSANGTLTVSNPNAQENDSTGARLQGIFDSYLKESQKIAPVSSADIYNRQYKEDGIKQKQQEVNNYASQINTITANRDAQVLSLEGSGRGQTTGFIGGEQGRINREAAIQALPVQAQLAASQGNLQLAQDHLNTMVSLKVADATNVYNRQTKLLDTVYQFATTAETRRLDELKAKNERTYQEKQDFLKVQASALSNALGQGAPASIYNAIKSATDKNGVILAAGQYNGDVLGRQLQQAQLASANRANRPSASKLDTQVIEQADGSKVLVNSQTGEVIKTFGAGTSGKIEVDKTVRRQLEDAVSSQESLIKLATEYKGIIKTSGFTNTIGGSPEKLGKINSLRALMTAEYKKAATLGSLDVGVLTLMEQILGEEPTSTFNPFANITGRRASKLGTQIDTFITQTESQKATAEARLGVGAQSNAITWSAFVPEDLDEINGMGVDIALPNSVQTSTGSQYITNLYQ